VGGKNKVKIPVLLQQLVMDNRLMLEMIYKAFLRLKEDLLKDVEKQGKEVFKDQQQIAELIAKGCPHSHYVTILSYMESIRENNLKIVQSVWRKNNERILFTDKAVKELQEVFLAVGELLQHTNDLLITDNMVLVEHIQNKTKEVGKKISVYGNEHEDRLVRGVCLPKSSIIYLLMMDSLNMMVYLLGNVSKAVLEGSSDCEKR